jgi:hypothetical protein
VHVVDWNLVSAIDRRSPSSSTPFHPDLRTSVLIVVVMSQPAPPAQGTECSLITQMASVDKNGALGSG